MRFAEPELLYLLLAIPVILGAAWLHAAWRRKALERFAGGPEQAARFTEQVSPHRRAVRVLLLLLAAGAGIVAAARPQWGTRLEPVTRKGVDVVVAIDTSASMAAQDASPDRLRAAQHATDSLLKRLSGDRVALVTFAGKATLACPMTLDSDAARLFLDSVDVELVPVPGTALADAVRVALRAFGPATASGQEHSRALVILSDGEDHEGGMDAALSDLKKAGVRVFAVGYGTRRGAPIPLGAEGTASSPGGYKKDRSDRIVTTRLNDEVLSALTLGTGGRYFDATPSEIEVDEVARGLAELDAREQGTLMRTRYEERFQIPLALAFAALVVQTLLGDRKRGRAAVAIAPKQETPS